MSNETSTTELNDKLSENGKKLLTESVADIEKGDYTICHGLDELISELARIDDE